jgi:signal transduction histidine kinase
MFSTFRGHLELASRMLEAGLLDSVPYHLEKAENAAKLLGDLEVDHHLTKVQQQYYFLRGDSVQVALYSQQLQHLDSAIALPVKDLAILLSNQLTEQANQSRDAISRRNRLLYGLVGLVSGLLVFVLIQTYRFNKQRKQLRRANDDKAMLYGMIAHDLRSPLAALDSVIRQEGIPASAQASIHSYARKLQFLLDDMLKWTFDQRQQLKPQPSSFDLVELVEENHHLLAQVLAEKLIVVQWDMEEEVVMYADREMISTCVRNMLQNAVKHSALGSQITIRCREEDGKAVLEIENEGSLSQRGGRSLGLQLIQSFSRLNNCRFSLEEHEGRAVAQLTGPNQ